jgi:hypothetical protein
MLLLSMKPQLLDGSRQILIMNAEYESHKKVWVMLKPRVYSQLEPTEPLAKARLPAGIPPPQFFDWYLGSMDLAVLAHGHAELASPLSEW